VSWSKAQITQVFVRFLSCPLSGDNQNNNQSQHEKNLVRGQSQPDRKPEDQGNVYGLYLSPPNELFHNLSFSQFKFITPAFLR
jgi:hypothetical protein